MDERAAFLAAICTTPTADVPRLVFADWLDEHDDPDRAAFIRAQCALTRADSLNSRHQSWRIESALLEQHQQQWLAELPRMPNVQFDTFERGFVVRATFGDYDAWNRHAATVFTAAPIHTVRVRLARPTVPMFASSVWLARVTTLDLNHSVAVDDVGVAALALSPYLAGVRHLRLAQNHITNTGARSLASRCCLTSLVELDLSDNLIGGVGAQALADAAHLQQLHRLRLSGNRIPPVVAARLRHRFGVRVEVDG